MMIGGEWVVGNPGDGQRLAVLEDPARGARVAQQAAQQQRRGGVPVRLGGGAKLAVLLIPQQDAGATSGGKNLDGQTRDLVEEQVEWLGRVHGDVKAGEGGFQAV